MQTEANKGNEDVVNGKVWYGQKYVNCGGQGDEHTPSLHYN